MGRTGDSERALLDELGALYREVDRLFAGARCEASTECCRFGITGREPQVTSLELALLRRAIAARGGPLSDKRRALPLARASSAERPCPLLARDGRCAVYDARPLGCRTFYCARADVPDPPSRASLTQVVRKLQDLAARHQPGGDRPRALSAALERDVRS